MKFIISGKNITVTEGLKTAVQDKLSKLERYFTPDTEVVVTLSVEKERQKIEVTIPVKGNIIRSEQVSNDMYVSIDLVEEVIVLAKLTFNDLFHKINRYIHIIADLLRTDDVAFYRNCHFNFLSFFFNT